MLTRRQRSRQCAPTVGLVLLVGGCGSSEPAAGGGSGGSSAGSAASNAGGSAAGGTTASAGGVCPAGVCDTRCPAVGETVCGSSCVILDSDPLHCGACGNQCGAGQTCDNGACTCPRGQQSCSGQCVNISNNDLHCGSCNRACASTESCVAGQCTAGTGGATGTGGASTGGISGGGTSTGGATGGAGTDTGGTDTGGVAAGGGSIGSTGGGSAAGAGTGGAATGGTSSDFDPRNPSFILGADVSWVQEQEDQGTVFRDSGVEGDIFQILKSHGFNYIRLRLFHTPGNPAGYQHEFVERAEPYCDTPHTIEVAQRIKNAGLGLSLDFHYSDTWADPDDQHKPLAWEGLSFADLVTALHDYTYDTLRQFETAGALPDMVQVGNEITPGMLLPDGSSSNFGNLAQLLNAGLAAINEVDSGIIKVMHIEGPHLPDTISWWANAAHDNGVEYDILGVSCYSAWHGSPETWQSTFQRVAAERPELRFMIAEYADNYRAANDVMYDLPQGMGTLFWEPTSDGEWGTGLFDGSGNSRDTLSLYDQMAIDFGLR